jgi:hypothetical protein
MEIKGPGRIESAPVRRAKNVASNQSAFTVEAETHAHVIAGPGPIAALDSILALQSLDDSLDGRSKGIKRGEQLLDMLDQVRDGLLAGGIPRTTLNRLAHAVTKRQDGFADPKLQQVLDEIELRAHVELAKLEQAEKRVV